MLPKPGFSSHFPRRVFMLAASLSLTAATILTACGGGGGGGSPASPPDVPPPDVPPTANAWSLHRTSEAELTAYFRTALGVNSKSYLGSMWALDAAGAASAAPAAGATAPIVSGTTLQETGVDEADLIKSDGSHVFNLESASATDFTRHVLRRQRFNAAAVDAALVPVDRLSIPFSAGVSGSGLYLDPDRHQLAVIAQGGAGGNMYDAWFAPRFWGQGVTEMALVDSADPAQMRLLRRLHITGQLIGSRRIGATLYLVLRSYPQVVGLDPAWPTDKTTSNQTIIDSLQATQLLPTLSVDGGVAQPLVSASDCFTQAKNATPSADVITLVGIDLASASEHHSARCFTGGSEAFYMSDQAIYLATTRNNYTYNGAFPVYAGQTSTDIHKFALSGLDIAYRGSGNVAGHLGFDQNRKSFRFGEYQGALRVITQSATQWGGWLAMPPAAGGAASTTASESPAHLSVLQESAGNLALVGELPNAAHPAPLGKAGEQLYASRFIGSRGYIVTYRLTDPLYVLDLSNPADPKVAGQLQVDGYSDYLFPLTENLLLGIGKDAAVVPDGSAGDGRFAWYQGVKLSLIDLSDPSQPREVARKLVGHRGTDATVLHDHHGIALQTVGNMVRLSLPVSRYDTPPLYPTGHANDYYQFTGTELEKFEIDLGSKSLSALAPLASVPPDQRDISDDRSLLWNNQLHYFHAGSWQSSPW